MNITTVSQLAEDIALLTFTPSLPSGEVRVTRYEAPKRVLVGTGENPSPAALYKLARTVAAKQAAHLDTEQEIGRASCRERV